MSALLVHRMRRLGTEKNLSTDTGGEFRQTIYL